MKKSKVTAAVLTGLLSVGALAACSTNPSYKPDGTILTYEVDGKTVNYTADQLFGDMVIDSEHAEEMFKQVYNLVVRNYFTIKNPDGKGTNTGSYQMEEIAREAESKVKVDEQTAEKNADTNGTTTKKEFEEILAAKDCETREDLVNYYIFEEQQSKIKENFYDIYADENNSKFVDETGAKEYFNYLRDGSKNDTNPEKKYYGYLESKVPYHVSHILVNVEDGAVNNYYNGTVSKANVEKFKRVIDGLMDSSLSFGSVAYAESDDGSGQSAYGDLGIVDKDKATEESSKYVKEFILGLYTYDNATNPVAGVQAHAQASSIGKTDITSSSDIAVSTMGWEVFDEMYAVKDYESTVDGTAPTFSYPRNYYYNKYLNNHGIVLITCTDAEKTGDPAKFANFKKIEGFTNLAGETGPKDLYVLCANGTTNPILMTRAGGSSYQGVHFITVTRSPFEDTSSATYMRDYTVDGVTLAEYYTTKRPGETGYPVDGGVDKQTYVNTLDATTAKYKERAEAVADQIETFDTDIEHVIYEKYISVKGEDGKTVALQFTEEGKSIEKTINSWLSRSKIQSEDETNTAWDEYWEEYEDNLKRQKEAESKKQKHGCALAFTKAAKAKTQAQLDAMTFSDCDSSFGTKTYEQLFNEIGGACNDGEKH